MTPTNQKLNAEEKKLLTAMNKGEFISAMKPEEKNYWEKVARKSPVLRERKQGIQIRLNPEIIDQAKVLAAHEGIPYQTKIQSLVHQWINDPKSQTLLKSLK